MLTWQQLRELRLFELEDAADGWGKVSNKAHAAHTRAESEMSGSLTKTQESESAKAAVKRIKRLEDNFTYLHIECDLVRTLLNGLASELTAPQRKLKHALEDASGFGCTVGPDGSVDFPHHQGSNGTKGHGTRGDGQGGDTDPNQARNARVEAIAADIAAAVRDANEIDGRYAAALARLTAPPGLEVTTAMMADAAGDRGVAQRAAAKVVDAHDVPQGRSAADNKKWWDGLTAEQRDAYIALYPGMVGALDGIPSVARDDANRMVLAETMGQVRQQLDSLGPEPPKEIISPHSPDPEAVPNPAHERWMKAGGGRLLAQWKAMSAVQAHLDRTGKAGLPEAYLLRFDTQGSGHAVIANGNPDTARHTAVFVPGTFAKPATIGIEGGYMTNLWKEGHAQNPGESLSTITWEGYDAPQNLATEASRQSFALKGGPRLDQFLDGLETAQGGAGASHTTVIGHSYGSTTVGVAAKAPGHLAADDILVAGSPGMLVGSADDLDVGRQHVWSEAAGVDPVPLLGKIGTLDGSWGLSNVPSDEAFGAHRMDVDTHDHRDYWRWNSESLKNQGSVVVGQYDRVKED